MRSLILFRVEFGCFLVLDNFSLSFRFRRVGVECITVLSFSPLICAKRKVAQVQDFYLTQRQFRLHDSQSRSVASEEPPWEDGQCADDVEMAPFLPDNNKNADFRVLI